MAADVLATKGAKASATMILTALNPQSLDTDVQRQFYSVTPVSLLPYFLIWEENDDGHVE